MIAVLDHVAEQCRRGINVVDDHVDVPIIKEIAKRRTPARDYIRQTASRGGRNFLEFGAIEIAEKLRPLRPGGAPILQVHLRIDVSIDDENVEQAIVIEVEEPGSPGQKRDGGIAQPRLICNIRKTSPAIIPIEGLVVVGKSCGEKIDLSVAVVISDADSHGCLLASIFAERESRSITHVFKRAVMPDCGRRSSAWNRWPPASPPSRRHRRPRRRKPDRSSRRDRRRRP